LRYAIYCCWLFFFFFKQKTAYEIGLGIPAEPLFRSRILVIILLLHFPSIKLRKCSSKIITSILSFISGRLATKSNQIKQLIRNEIGRASCRERVKISVIAVYFKKKIKYKNISRNVNI